MGEPSDLVEEQEDTGRRNSGLMSLTLFSAFAIAANLATAVHEFGHALGCWRGRGRVTAVVLRPFDFSYVSTDMGTAPPWGHMLMSGGGILFGVLLALPLLPLSRLFPRGSPGWLVLFMTVTLAFGLNGVLLLVSALTGHGDAEAVLVYGHLGYGIPTDVLRILFCLCAIPLLAVFGRLLSTCLRTFGPAPEDSYARWVLTVEAGFLPYFLLMTGHTAIFGDRALLLRQLLPFYLPYMLAFAFMVLAAATRVYQAARPVRQQPAAADRPTWAKAAFLFSLACAVIGAELAFLGPP